MNFNYLAAALGPVYMVPIVLQEQTLKKGVGVLHNKAAVTTFWKY